MKINIVFTEEINPDKLSKTIQKIEKIGSHCLIIYQDLDGKRKINHAIGKGVLIDPDLSYFKTHNKTREFEVELWCTQEEYCAWVNQEAAKHIKYSFKQFVNQFLRLIGLSWVPFKNGDKEQICCEWAARTLDKWGKIAENFDILDAIGLAQLEQVLEKSPQAKRIL